MHEQNYNRVIQRLFPRLHRKTLVIIIMINYNVQREKSVCFIFSEESLQITNEYRHVFQQQDCIACQGTCFPRWDL